MEIKNAWVLITGANRGIGRAVAEMCATNGAHLILGNRTKDGELVKSLQALGAPSVIELQLDLSDPQHIESFLKELGDQRVDVLFNNSGQLVGGLFENQNLKEIYSMMQVNVLGLIHLTHRILPGMLKRGKGKIINHSSVSAVMSLPTASTYAASKAAVRAFTDILRLELKGTGVTALVLLTPGVNTRMFNEIPEKSGPHIKGGVGDSLSPKIYADRIKEAILEDLTVLAPSGMTGAMMKIAHHSPKIFERMVLTRFRR